MKIAVMRQITSPLSVALDGDMGTGHLQRLSNLHPYRFSQLNWERPWLNFGVTYALYGGLDQMASSSPF